jgi:hypothetical protein
MKEEIFAGIRNAMERGATLEAAANTFLNAGYNPQDVRAAVAAISEGASEIVYTKFDAPVNQDSLAAPELNAQSLPALPTLQPTGKKKSKAGIIFVIILLILIFLGALSYLIYSLTK